MVETTSSEPSTGYEEFSYDSLFAATTEPAVIVDSLRGSVISANAAAARLLGVPRTRLVGMPLPIMLEGPGPGYLKSALETARITGVARMDTVRFRATALDLSARLSLVRAGKASYVLAHFSPAHVEFALPQPLHANSLVYDVIDSGTTVLVVTDSQLNLLYANRAFLRLIEIDSLAEAAGHSLSRWLDLSREDLERMRAQMAAREMATTVSVKLSCGPRGRYPLQALAIAVPNGGQSVWAFNISERPRVN